MFRNVRLYRLVGDWPDSENSLSQTLHKAAFSPCGPLTERSSGWIAADPNNAEMLARRLHGADLIKLRSQSRVLPAAVINEALEERVDEFRNRMQEEPGRREKRRLKAETRDKLLPKALLKSDRTWGFMDLGSNIIAIDAAQASVAERFIRHLRTAFGELDIRPLKFQQPVGELLTRIFLGNAPAQFNVGRECRMQDASDAGSTVRWSDFDLSDPTIRSHVADGMRLTHLAIEYDNIVGCVLDENGVLSKLHFPAMEDKETGKDNDPIAQLDAEFVLLTGALRQMLADLKKLLGGFAA